MRFSALALAVCILLGWAFVARAEADLRSRVVVIHTTEARPYRLAVDALRASLGPSVEWVEEQVDRDDASAPARISSRRPDAIVAVGTQATAWARDHTQVVPIVFAMVLNPVSGGLIDSMHAPGGRITGASLDIPPRRQLEVLRDLVDAKRIAVLYDPDETGAVVEEARRAASEAGLDLVTIEVRDPTELEDGLARLDGSIDALWSVADPTVLSRGVVEKILLHTLERGIPFMGLSAQYVRAGALLALETSYDENGRQAARMLERVLRGEPARSLSIAVPASTRVVFNPNTADRLRVRLRSTPTLSLRPVR